MIIKRYILALLGFLAAWFGLSVLLDAIPLPSSATGVFSNHEEADRARGIILLWLNSIVAVQSFFAYAVGAYLLRKSAVVPGLLVYALMALPAIWILYEIALPAQPSITVVGIVSGNLSGWISSFVACVAGLLLGEQLARYHCGSRADA